MLRNAERCGVRVTTAGAEEVSAQGCWGGRPQEPPSLQGVTGCRAWLPRGRIEACQSPPMATTRTLLCVGSTFPSPGVAQVPFS